MISDGFQFALGAGLGYLVIFLIAISLVWCVFLYVKYRIRLAAQKVKELPAKAASEAATSTKTAARAAGGKIRKFFASLGRCFCRS